MEGSEPSFQKRGTRTVLVQRAALQQEPKVSDSTAAKHKAQGSRVKRTVLVARKLREDTDYGDHEFVSTSFSVRGAEA